MGGTDKIPACPRSIQEPDRYNGAILASDLAEEKESIMAAFNSGALVAQRLRTWHREGDG